MLSSKEIYKKAQYEKHIKASDWVEAGELRRQLYSLLPAALSLE